MRLRGSFHTMTIQGTSGVTSCSSIGRSTSTGAVWAITTRVRAGGGTARPETDERCEGPGSTGGREPGLRTARVDALLDDYLDLVGQTDSPNLLTARYDVVLHD